MFNLIYESHFLFNILKVMLTLYSKFVLTLFWNYKEHFELKRKYLREKVSENSLVFKDSYGIFFIFLKAQNTNLHVSKTD